MGMKRKNRREIAVQWMKYGNSSVNVAEGIAIRSSAPISSLYLRLCVNGGSVSDSEINTDVKICLSSNVTALTAANCDASSHV